MRKYIQKTPLSMLLLYILYISYILRDGCDMMSPHLGIVGDEQRASTDVRAGVETSLKV
jgi:hypothetical protein